MRIFIDCSYIDFSRQPTGIPRVVLKYIEAGYAWSEINEIDVVPVVTTSAGLIPVRPVPGKNPPQSTIKYIKRSTDDQIELNGALPLLKESAMALKLALGKAGSSTTARGIEVEVLSLFSKILASENLEIDVGPGDVVFFPAYWHDLETKLLHDLKKSGARLFILVHDILPIKFKRFYQTPWREQFADNLLGACRVADGMFAVSRYTANDVLSFAQSNGLDLKKVEVFHNAFDSLIDEQAIVKSLDGQYLSPFASKKKHEFLRIENPYLMVGTIEPKKGHIPTIQMFEDLWRDGLKRKLILVGRRGWMDEDVVHAIKNSPYYEEKLFWFDDFNDVDLFFAYNHSRALIFSSYAEGFGIPLIEAAKAGVPMICYDTEVAREVAGGYALYYSKQEEFKNHINAVEDDDNYHLYKKSLVDFSWPTWQDMGEKLFNRLVQTIKESPPA